MGNFSNQQGTDRIHPPPHPDSTVLHVSALKSDLASADVTEWGTDIHGTVPHLAWLDLRGSSSLILVGEVPGPQTYTG